MKNNPKILYLYSEIMGYNISTIDNLIILGAEVHLVHWDHKKLAKYKIINKNNFNIYPRSEFNKIKLLKLVTSLEPDITIVSGWMDSTYLYIARYLKNKNSKIVCGIDNHWKPSIKNIILRIIFKLNIHKFYFSHFWVAGNRQYQYVKKLGINEDQIIYELYSADTKHFENIFKNTIQYKKNNYPHKFIYIGRLSKEKGLFTLIEAWKSIKNQRRDWKLILIGNGT